MAGFTKKLTCFFLFFLVLLLAATVAWWGIIQLQWPIWLGAAMGAGVIACFLFILFLRKYLIRRREKKLVEQIVEQGQVIDADAVPELLHVKELEKNWSSNLALLRSSHLRRKGNPVYVLPWYLVIGAAGIGKTAAVNNSGLPASFTEVEQNNQVQATRNCDWWFLDKAIILDTAGRYSIPIEGMADQDEWKCLLRLLVKHRKKEPLNGILLFVAADVITDVAADLLKKQGQLLRNRINHLMRTIGYKIPVRLIVTKMDLVPGFVGFAKSFEPSDRRQVMGYWNRKANPFWQEVLDDVIRETGERLRELRKKYVLVDGGSEPDFFVFPTMFDGLHTGLKNFLEPVFSENRFQETPYLAGVYFGSGQSGKASLSAGFRSPDTAMNQRHSESGQAFFFADLFSRILADGRERLEPVKEFLLWRQVTHNLGLMSWWLFCLFCAGLVGISFMHNQQSLTQAAEIHPPSPAASTSEDSNATILELEHLRLKITDLQELNRSRKMPDIGFSQASRAEKELKERYCTLFESSLQQPMENGLSHGVSGVDQHTPNDLFSDYTTYTVEHINLLQDSLAGEPPEANAGFNSAVAHILSLEDTTTVTFADQDHSHLLWNDDRTGTRSRLKTLRSNLEKLLENRGDDTSWLYHQMITKTDPVKLRKFWHHAPPDEYGIFSVPGAFTENGRKEIHRFFEMISKAGDNEVVKDLRHRFNTSYESKFFAKWYAFAKVFPHGYKSFDKETDWRDTAIRMTTNSNPYFTIIATMATELNSFAEEANIALPPWAEAVVAFNEVKKMAATSRKADGKKLSALKAKAKMVKERFMKKALSKAKVGRVKVGAGGTKFVVDELALAKAWDAYEKALTPLEAATTYKEKTFQLVSNWFHEAAKPGEKTSLYGTTYQTVVTLHGLAKGTYDNSLVWRLVKGPFDFLTEFGLRESAAVLQEQWREQVVTQSDTLNNKDKLLNLLFEETEGVVWNFVKTTGGPFVQKIGHGYQPREAFGRHLTFEPSLYSFLDKGAAVVINKQSEYRVTISNRPLLVNRDATEEPYAATITVQCAEDKIVLENDNYPRSQTFNWSPDKCGDVDLTIEFPDVTLHKNYTGSMAFARFLSNFIDGALRLTSKDFPDKAGHLRDSNIKEIVLTYAITGQGPILRLLSHTPAVPKVIIRPEQQSDVVVARPENERVKMTFD